MREIDGVTEGLHLELAVYSMCACTTTTLDHSPLMAIRTYASIISRSCAHPQYHALVPHKLDTNNSLRQSCTSSTASQTFFSLAVKFTQESNRFRVILIVRFQGTSWSSSMLTFVLNIEVMCHPSALKYYSEIGATSVFRAKRAKIFQGHFSVAWMGSRSILGLGGFCSKIRLLCYASMLQTIRRYALDRVLLYMLR